MKWRRMPSVAINSKIVSNRSDVNLPECNNAWGMEILFTISWVKIKMIEQMKWKPTNTTHAHESMEWFYSILFRFVYCDRCCLVCVHCRNHFIALIHLFYVWIYVTKSDRHSDSDVERQKSKLYLLIFVRVCKCVCAGYFCFSFYILFFSYKFMIGKYSYKIMCMMISNGRSRFCSHTSMSKRSVHLRRGFCFVVNVLDSASLLVISLAFSIASFTAFVCHFGATLITVCAVRVRMREWISFDLISFAS